MIATKRLQQKDSNNKASDKTQMSSMMRYNNKTLTSLSNYSKATSKPKRKAVCEHRAKPRACYSSHKSTTGDCKGRAPTKQRQNWQQQCTPYLLSPVYLQASGAIQKCELKMKTLTVAKQEKRSHNWVRRTQTTNSRRLNRNACPDNHTRTQLKRRQWTTGHNAKGCNDTNISPRRNMKAIGAVWT